jgi:hypothetical protein
MAILSGRNGTVKYNAIGASSPGALVTLVSINGWKLSLKTDYEEVTCFGDTNKVYIPGLRDISGTISGYWNSADQTIIHASAATTPGLLFLQPNTTDAIGSPLVAPSFSGTAYLDADIDCTVNGAPKLTSSFRAAGAWQMPS